MFSFFRFIDNFKGGLYEGYDFIIGTPSRYRQKSKGEMVISIVKIALLPMMFYLGRDLPLDIQIMGVIAVIAIFTSQRFKNNKHINAIHVCVTFLFFIQSIMLDNYAYAVMTGLACVRSFVMAMLPDSDEVKNIRKIMAGISMILGTIMVVLLGIFQSVWNLLPVGAMACGTYASSLVNDDTRKAHVLYIVGSGFNVIYSLIFYNPYAMVAECIAIINHTQSVIEMGKKPQSDGTL